MLNQVVTATLRILFFRAGPQDFPFDPSLSRWLIPVAVAINYGLATLTLPTGLAAISAIAAITGLSVAARTVLRLRNVENRYVQTYHSLLATGSVMALAFIFPTAELVPTILKYAQNPAALEQGAVPADLPASAVLMFDVLLIWNFAVTANIFRQATGLRTWAGVLIAMAVSITLLMFVGFAASTVGALFGLTPPPAATVPAATIPAATIPAA